MTSTAGGPSGYAAALIVRRVIRASPERLFDAWTDPLRLVQWWGPEGVTCTQAAVDARPGGAYRIANRLPDGAILWIGGQFEVVERPRVLVFSWQIEGAPSALERVSVDFRPVEHGTEVVVTHERIAYARARERHESGWQGCLAGLARYAT
jgi:uncharacterized protein YndB with AHSA1/START domain